MFAAYIERLNILAAVDVEDDLVVKALELRVNRYFFVVIGAGCSAGLRIPYGVAPDIFFGERLVRIPAEEGVAGCRRIGGLGDCVAGIVDCVSHRGAGVAQVVFEIHRVRGPLRVESEAGEADCYGVLKIGIGVGAAVVVLIPALDMIMVVSE